MQNKISVPFTEFVSIVIVVFCATACTLDTMGCGGEPFDASIWDSPVDAQVEANPTDAGPDHKVEAGHDAKPEVDAHAEDAAKPDVAPDAIEAGEDAVAEAEASVEPQPEAGPDVVAEAAPDVVVDAPEEPPTGICATQGHDGKIMVHPMVTLGPTAYLTVFGMLTYPSPGPTTPFEGWCWSAQGGQGEFNCFPKIGGNEASATPGTKVLLQIGTTNGPSGPPSYYLCDFGVCPVNVVVCAGKTEACHWFSVPVSGDIVYKEPGHNGKGELICILP